MWHGLKSNKNRKEIQTKMTFVLVLRYLIFLNIASQNEDKKIHWCYLSENYNLKNINHKSEIKSNEKGKHNSNYYVKAHILTFSFTKLNNLCQG